VYYNTLNKCCHVN